MMLNEKLWEALKAAGTPEELAREAARSVSDTGMIAELGKSVDARFNQVDARFDKIASRFDKIDSRLGGIELGMVDVKADLRWMKLIGSSLLAVALVIAGRVFQFY